MFSRYDAVMARADEYHSKALWQEKLRTLDEALSICQEPSFPEAEQRRQNVLRQKGGVLRRFGQYEDAALVLKDALEAYSHANPVTRANILGELGVVHRHRNDFTESLKTFKDQYRLALKASLEADAELCRAVGNEGMSMYNLARIQPQRNPVLFESACDKLRERISRARRLYERVEQEDPANGLSAQSRTWEKIGLDRLSLTLTAAGHHAEAIEVSLESQDKLPSEDPTIRAFSRFVYGWALWHNAQQDEAIVQWTAPANTCTSAMALCKEPCAEHVDYLEVLITAGLKFDMYDEQGFSALDYATLSDNSDAQRMAEMLLDAARPFLQRKFEGYVPKLSEGQVRKRVETDIAASRRQASLRRHYRDILQQQVRRELWTGNINTIKRLRTGYVQTLSKSEEKRGIFDVFRYVRYTDFRNHGRLPLSIERITRTVSDTVDDSGSGEQPDFVIFLSYRWIGYDSEPVIEGPDNVHDTQWQRMVNAIEGFLEKNHGIDREKLGLWLDCACIDQHQPQRRESGVDSISFALMQCNAMISLVDDTYYTQAWRVFEVLLIQELMQYGLHDWWEHILHDAKLDQRQGALRRGNISRALNVTNLQFSCEVDRPKIDFLIRQSRLLGRDDY